MRIIYVFYFYYLCIYKYSETSKDWSLSVTEIVSAIQGVQFVENVWFVPKKPSAIWRCPLGEVSLYIRVNQMHLWIILLKIKRQAIRV